MMDLHIGCTGWSYDQWVGPFYPKNIKKTDYLKFYSGIFDCTEVDSSFYRIPTQFMTKKWYADTPDNFRFSAKFPQVITHENRLGKVEKNYLELFFYGMNPLREKIFALVIQLPPSLKFEEAKPKLEELLDIAPKGYQYVVEGRHNSWFSPDALDFLREKKVTLAWNEIPQVDSGSPVTNKDLVYLRIVGDRSIPEEEFGKVHYDKTDVLKKWVTRLQERSDEIRHAVVMVDNHFVGFAPATANHFRALLDLKELLFIDKKQKTLFDV